MSRGTCTIRIDFSSTQYNGWPIIKILGNNQLLWQGEIQSRAQVTVEIELKFLNQLKISLINKNNGPDRWDTLLDDHNVIIEDKQCVINAIYFDRARFIFFHDELAYYLSSGEVEYPYGYMSLNGFYQIEFPQNVYDWIIDRRIKRLPKRATQSALSYDSVYFNESNDNINKLIDECKNILNDF
jgi:hypothetical protein